LEKINEFVSAKKSICFIKEMTANYRDIFNLKPENHIMIKEKGCVIKINLEEVLWIEGFGNYAKLKDGNKSYLYRGTLKALENMFVGITLIRINRSYLVNTIYIRDVRYNGNNQEYQFELEGGYTLSSSRYYKEKMEEFLLKSHFINRKMAIN
jgi:DNA-binding LytR/AlgR family response regulator